MVVRVLKGMALHSWWRLDRYAEDKFGNDSADVSADFGRLQQLEKVVDARRSLSSIRHPWYPTLMDLHRFMVAVSRTAVDTDGRGGNAPQPVIHVFVDALVNPPITVTNTQGMSSQTVDTLVCVASSPSFDTAA